MSKKQSKARRILWIVIAVLLCALVGGAAYGYFGWQVPYLGAQNTMPVGGTMTMWEQADGSLLLNWPAGQNADRYTVQVLNDAGQSLYTYETSQCSCVLPVSLSRDTEVTLRVQSGGAWRDQYRPGDAALEVKTLLMPPKVENLRWSVDPDTSVAQILFDHRADTHYTLYLASEDQPETVQTLSEGQATLKFGEGTNWPVPEFEKKYTILLDATREIPGLAFYGNICASLELTREDFLGTALHLQNNDLGNNAWQLFWNETKGDHYEIQQWVDDNWQTVAVVSQEEELTYHTGHLPKFQNIAFRVVAVGGQAEDVQSEPVHVNTGVAAVYCTIWPQRELDVYADETRTQVLGTVEAGTALCVLEEKTGLFGVRWGDGVGYIDSNYCMINLPEYMEDLCQYQITNSYSSLFMVHDYEIEKVTGTVFPGYEHVRLSQNEYLVPFLYPAAKKLVKAAYAARDEGYVLKIYDSFRPHKASTYVYEQAGKILSDPIPAWTYAEKLDRLAMGLPVEPTEPPTEPTQEGADGTEETVPPATEQRITYQMLMTDNGRYYLGNFLAPGTSTHNLGVALDMTMVDLKTGKEVTMQTAIHDLSWYSEVKKNTEAGLLMSDIMVEAGFVTLESEWWHFQDHESRTALGLEPLEQGISAKCWMADDKGWRYRKNDGSYCINCTETIDGVTYAFDALGYVIENG